MNPLIRDSTAIAKKELKQLGRDPLSLALTIMFPILLISMFTVISGAFRDSHAVPVVIADLDESAQSKMFIDELSVSRLIRVAQLVQTEERALATVKAGEAIGSVVIPKDFGNKLLNARAAFVVLQTDNSKVMASFTVIRAVADRSRELLNKLNAQFNIRLVSVDVVPRPVSGRPPNGDFILPGYLGLITILGAFDDAVNAITRERERGTYTRLVLTPMNLFSIYGGKMAAALVINAMRTSFVLMIFVLSGLVIQGNILIVFLITSLISMFTLSLSMMISSRIRSSATLTIMEIAITFPLFQLTGAFSAPEILPAGGRAISRALPWTWGNEALRRIMYLGLDLNAISADILVLVISIMIFLPLATLLSKRTM